MKEKEGSPQRPRRDAEENGRTRTVHGDPGRPAVKDSCVRIAVALVTPTTVLA
jgi:hypothetical protein